MQLVMHLARLVCLLAALALTSLPVWAQDTSTVAAPDTTDLPVAIDADAPEDSALEARMQSVFARIDDFEDVQVSVEDGVVVLTGSVIDAQAKDRATELARRFEGVIFVDNDIEQTTDVETRVTPALRRLQDYWGAFVSNLPVIVVALLVIVLFWFLGRAIGRWRAPFERFGVTRLVQNLVGRVVSTVFVLIGLLLALDILGITALVGAVLGTAGVFGIAIGFAFQDIVENYLAGILLSLQRPFNIGDLIVLEGHTGKIVRLTARELVLMTLDGNHVRIANATVFKSTLINYTRNPRRQFNFGVGVGTGEDLARAMEVGLQTLRAMPGVMNEPGPFARVENLGDSTVTVRFHGWVDQQQADFFKVQSEAIRLVKQALDDAGVEMPEPIYRVLMRQLPADEAPQPPPSPMRSEVRDLSPDTVLDAQVQEDLARSDESNLLEGS